MPGVSAGIVTFYAVQASAPVPASHCVELPTLPGVGAGIVAFYAVQPRASVPASHCVELPTLPGVGAGIVTFYAVKTVGSELKSVSGTERFRTLVSENISQIYRGN